MRILHHMARSGGTVISKCLGCMEGVALLSEIHPFAGAIHNPLVQASEWFRIFSPEDLQSLQGRSLSFPDAIELIRERVESSGRCLVIRDWTHLDFTGVPFLENPSCRLTTAAVLGQRYRVVNTATVRHPVDQWISLNKLDMFRFSRPPGIEKFLAGYLRFAEVAAGIGFVRYEDFARDSDAALRTLCARLQVPYDAGYRDKWAAYETITGDNTTPSGSRLVRQSRIAVLPRQAGADAILEEFRRCPDYHRAIDLLGYPDAI